VAFPDSEGEASEAAETHQFDLETTLCKQLQTVVLATG
jgi:hypothetical protein